MNKLIVDNISISFGGNRALEKVSFGLEEGEILGLMGPNGSGKTTLINIITGLIQPDEGKIVYDGTEIQGLKTYAIARMGIARTFQIVRPFSNLTVLDNIRIATMFGRNSQKTSALRARRAEEIVEYIGLSQKKDVLAGDTTIPDRKRIELGKALAMSPQVLLLDEVMAGLNMREVEDSMRLIRDINSRGVCILMVEHVMKAIMRMSDRIIVLQYGSKLAEGIPSEIFSNKNVIEAYLGKRFLRTRGADVAGN